MFECLLPFSLNICLLDSIWLINNSFFPTLRFGNRHRVEWKRRKIDKSDTELSWLVFTVFGIVDMQFNHFEKLFLALGIWLIFVFFSYCVFFSVHNAQHFKCFLSVNNFFEDDNVCANRFWSTLSLSFRMAFLMSIKTIPHIHTYHSHKMINSYRD